MVTALADADDRPERTQHGYTKHDLDRPLFPRTKAERVRVRMRNLLRQKLVTVGDPNLTRLPTLPGVSSLSIATRYLPGGRPRFVEYVQFAALNDNEIARAWLFVYDDLMPSERVIVSFDDVCAASGVKPSDLMALVVTTAMEYGIDVGNLVAAAGHPEVVAAGVESAKRIAGKGAGIGLRDREMLYQHQNFLPSGRGGPVVNVHNNASANAQAAAVADADPSVPSFAATVRALRSVTPQLGPANESLDPIDVDMAALTGDAVPAKATG